jgi:hypothetical protein
VDNGLNLLAHHIKLAFGASREKNFEICSRVRANGTEVPDLPGRPPEP